MRRRWRRRTRRRRSALRESRRGSSTRSRIACSYGRPGDHLDHPAGQRDGGVVVREHGSRPGQLRQAVQCGHVPGQRVRALTRVELEVAQPSGAVVEQLPHGHPVRHRRIRGAQVGQVRAHAPVEVDGAPLDQPHHRGAGDGLGGGPDPEDGVTVDRARIIHVGHAEAVHVVASAVSHGDRDAGDGVALHAVADAGVQGPYRPGCVHGGRRVAGPPWQEAGAGRRRGDRGGAQRGAPRQCSLR